ncbi:hypothetical protein V6N12_013055 [Hibiscus sabdariffa]|uniref:F-box domain-containing protein n=1 Tax=Hibiscus sabdariffa TaxID=183260 RepID=A0ABR2EG83_9ROSI
MNRRVRQKRECGQEKEKTHISSETLECGCLTSATFSGVDWTTLPDDTVIQLFSYLNYRDRASLASTCQTFRLLVIAARHEMLESVHLGPDACERISCDAIKALASCCPRLQRLWLSGVKEVNGDSINALAKHYVSRIDVILSAVTGFLSSSQKLKVLPALNCSVFEGEVDGNLMHNHKGKILLTFLSDMFKGVASLFDNNSKNVTDAFQYWRRLKNRDKNVDEIVVWIECVLSHSLLRIAENNVEFDDFWLTQGVAILLSSLRSSQKEVQERAATAVATFVVIDDENVTVDCKRAQAILRGIRSCQEGLQSEAAKAIANLSIDSKVAKAVAESGGINILASLAKSIKRLVVEEVVGGLWNLSVGDDHKGAIVKVGGIKALVDLIFKCPSSTEGLLERPTGALANLGADDKCSLEVVVAGGIHALVMLARTCKFDGVQEQSAGALANLVAHGDSNENNAAIGQGEGALEALIQLTYSKNEGVRQEAVGALWNLSFDDKNREAIAAAGGVEALV